jgi:2-polyprenyl-3-methyl-5-hydroxy-6-metoxy-1,4-benzoquinol methylase
MSELISNCPICGSTGFEPYLEVTDFTVSQEVFHLVKCSDCELVYTNPRPDANSIGKYYKSTEYISHTNSKKGLVNSLYQMARRRAITTKLEFIGALAPEPRTLLDYGCGTGEFLAAAKEEGWICAGLEPDDDARKLAQENHSLNVDHPMHLKDLPIGQFGAITLWHVLEHVHDLRETVDQLKTRLSSKGVLVIAVPNRTAYEAGVYGPYWAAYDVPRHLYHFSKKPMLRLMDNAGFVCESIKPLFFDPFYISLLSSGYKNGSKNLFAAVWYGIKTTLKGKKNIEENSSLLYVFKKK